MNTQTQNQTDKWPEPGLCQPGFPDPTCPHHRSQINRPGITSMNAVVNWRSFSIVKNNATSSRGPRAQADATKPERPANCVNDLPIRRKCFSTDGATSVNQRRRVNATEIAVEKTAVAYFVLRRSRPLLIGLTGLSSAGRNGFRLAALLDGRLRGNGF